MNSAFPKNQITRTVAALAATAMALTNPTPAFADWTQAHRGADQNRTVSASPIADLPTSPTFATSAGGNLQAGAPALLWNGRLIAVARTSGSTPTVVLKSFDKSTGAHQWTSPPLDASVNTFSVSSPAVDAATGKVFYATGTAMYRIDGTSGALDWTTTMTATNTDPTSTARYVITNSSPALGGGRVFIHTYETSFVGPYTNAQVVAFDQVSGAVSWFAKVGGVGSTCPIYVGTTTTPLVLAAKANGAGEGAWTALNAATGATVWDSTTVAAPWTSPNLFWGDAVIAGGKAYAVDYNFSGTGGTLSRFDVATGAREYVKPALTADCPPVLTAAGLHVFGGSYSAPRIATYAPATGDLVTSAPTGGNVFRQYPAAAGNRLYVAIAGQGVRAYDTVTLAMTGTSAINTYDGPVTLDDNGALFAPTGTGDTGRIRGWRPLNAVGGWDLYE